MIGLLVRDRPELLSECLRTLLTHTLGGRIVAHLDAADPECAALVEDSGLETIVSPERVGIAAGLNKLLALRGPGEDFVRVDSDVKLLTHDWLRILTEGSVGYGLTAPLWTGNRYEEETRDFLAGKTHPSHIETTFPLGGVVFHPGEVVDKIGGYRSHGTFYGCQERDYAARARGLGLPVAYVTGVLVEHPPTPVVSGPRRWELEEALPKFKKAAKDYERGVDLYEVIHG